MTPQQKQNISDDRRAIAPYNFVPLPEQIVRAEASFEQVRHDHYDNDPTRHTGSITCTLTTASPLFVRSGLDPDDFAALADKSFDELDDDQKQRYAQFFHYLSEDQPVIPGSTLRGMLRALVEIAGYGKMERVTDKPRYFYRAFAAEKGDSLGNAYDLAVGRSGSRVLAGYLERQDGRWCIRPAVRFRTQNNKGQQRHITFAWVDEASIVRAPNSLLKDLSSPKYQIVWFEVRFSDIVYNWNNYRFIAQNVSEQGTGAERGFLVTSGNMKETDPTGTTKRRHHCVVMAKDEQASLLEIDPQAIEDYRVGRSDFQRQHPFDELNGMLAEGRPVFYCPADDNEANIVYFGHSPNFRIPYRVKGSQRASTPRDFVPLNLRHDDDTDLAEAIFGYVRGSDQGGEGEQMRAGRVFVGDAVMTSGDLSAHPVTPQILASPKPTTFQHYLVQTNDGRLQLKHFASVPGVETVIRGHKLYWHKGAAPSFTLPPNQQQTSDTQKTLIRPVQPGARFEFTIRFENLSDVELGALLWVLRLTEEGRQEGKQYRLKLGMSKPLGLGAVKLESRLTREKRSVRYQQLFSPDSAGWHSGEIEDSAARDAVADRCVTAFNDYVLDNSGERDRTPSGRLQDTLRMQMLLALLSWPGPLPAEQFSRYMEIEREAEPRIGRDPNEYKERRVLPTPKQVHDMAQASPAPVHPVAQEPQILGSVVAVGPSSATVRLEDGKHVRPQFAPGLARRLQSGERVELRVRAEDGTYEIVRIVSN